MSKMSEIHITLSNSHTRSTSVVDLVLIEPVTHKARRIMLAKYQGFSREEAADALMHWRDNNPSIAKHITLERTERTTMF
jgi:hypothetical protein